ncbi:MAG TPA: hypothetical protein VEZ90_19735 [Blastocatellia bacterium]|nr:hypothetical protein [Blastocatellia bacterium]
MNYKLLLISLVAAVTTGWYRPAQLDVEKVPRSPFAARYEVVKTWAAKAGSCPANDTLTGIIRRDALGRTRDESNGSTEAPVSAVEIYDPVAGLVCLLDPVTGSVWGGQRSRVSNFRRPLFSKMPDGRLDFVLPFAIDRDQATPMGRRVIEGVLCDGYQMDGELGDIFGGGRYHAELWLSEDLGWTVLEKVTAPGTTQSYRLWDIKMVTPNPTLFVIPTEHR